MTLAERETAFVAAASGTDIVSVFFDYNKAASIVQTKDYPLVLWDFVGMEELGPLRSNDPKATLSIFVWAVKKYVPDTDPIPEWDALRADLEEYLSSVNDSEFITVNQIQVAKEQFPPGFFSADREIAVRYRVTLTLWC